MADDKGDKSLKDKLGRLLAKAVELHEQQAAVIAEMQGLVGGAAGIGATLKRLEHFYSDVWKVRYGAPYVWTFQQDVPALKRLLKTLAVDEVERRMLAYVQHSDKYYIEHKHPFRLFVRNVNDYAAEIPTLGLDAPVLMCRHDPPCQTDQEHTRRRADEMRA